MGASCGEARGYTSGKRYYWFSQGDKELWHKYTILLTVNGGVYASILLPGVRTARALRVRICCQITRGILDSILKGFLLDGSGDILVIGLVTMATVISEWIKEYCTEGFKVIVQFVSLYGI